jgi:hypothetical protein
LWWAEAWKVSNLKSELGADDQVQVQDWRAARLIKTKQAKDHRDYDDHADDVENVAHLVE